MADFFDAVLAGGFFMVPLLLCSVVSVAVIVERFSALTSRRILGEELPRLLGREKPVQADLDRAMKSEKTVLARLVRVACGHSWSSRDEAMDALRSSARRETTRMERGLVVLEIVAGLAPLLGLLGTVSGLVRIFGNIGPDGLGDQGVEVARGIAEALTTTIAGLVIAIPSLICWNLLTRRVDIFATELDHHLQALLRMMGRGGDAL